MKKAVFWAIAIGGLAAVAFSVLCVHPKEVKAMPPHERLKIKDPPGHNRRTPKLAGFQPFIANAPAINFNTLVLLVDFADKPFRTAPAYFDALMFGATRPSFKHFYAENSYGQFNVFTENLPSAIGVSRLPQSYAYYTDSLYGFSGYPQNAQKMAEDAAKAADPFIDFSRYDNNGDGYVDGIIIIHAGSGAELTGSVNDVWSHKSSLVSPLTLDGVKVFEYCSTPEYWNAPGDMTLGVIAHEAGHLFFDLPDLYSICGDGQGLGRWSLMAAGGWNGSTGLGDSPAHLDGWSKKKCGFLSPIWLTAPGTYTLSAIENVPQIYQLGSDTEMFLMENRQKTGYDASLPGAGLLIYHLKSAFYQCKGWYPGRTADSARYLIALEQADGLFHLEKNLSTGNLGDPYPGSTGSTRFDSASNPNSHWYFGYTGRPSGVSITQISGSGPVMTFVLGGSSPPPPPPPPDTVRCQNDTIVRIGNKKTGKVVTFSGECNPPSGSFFPVGQTSVSCTQPNCTFIVNVQRAGKP